MASKGNDISILLKDGAFSVDLTTDPHRGTIDLSQACHPFLAHKAARVRTFQEYPIEHRQSVDELTELGFFSCGYADCCRCFYCGLGLKYWRPADEASTQHALFRPDCSFNLWVKGSEFIENCLRTHASNIVSNMKSSPVVTEVMNETMWTQKNITFGLARLIVTKKPLTKQSLTDAVISVKTELSNTAVLDKENPFEIEPVPEPVDSLTIMLEEEVDYYRNRLICSKCHVNKVNIINLPCGHIVTCEECEKTTPTCIYCNENICGISNIYLS